MYQFFTTPDQIRKEEGIVTITGPDVNHMKNVLRMQPGEEVAVSNGSDGLEYRCRIASYEEDSVNLDLLFVREENVELPAKVYLFQGLPKADKMELIIQKAVELGVYEIIPVATDRAVVKLDQKKEKSKLERWNAISEAAAKQSRRAIIPNVHGVMNFRQAIQYAETMQVRMIPYELAEGMEQTRAMFDHLDGKESIAVFIGPEGGFTREEIAVAKACGIEPISLGKRILRTETAGMTVLSILMYRLEK